jgi:hypothetical protein
MENKNNQSDKINEATDKVKGAVNDLASKVDKEKLEAKTNEAKAKAEELKNVVESGIKAKDPKVLGVLGGAAAVVLLGLGLMLSSGNPISDFENKTWRPDSNSPFFKTMEGAAIKMAIAFMPEAADIQIKPEGLFSVAENNYSLKGEWKKDGDKIFLIDSSDNKSFYIYKQGENLCADEIGNNTPLCYNNITK